MPRDTKAHAPAAGGVSPRARSPLYRPPDNSRRMRVVIAGPWQVPAWLVEFIELAGDSAWIEVVVLPVHGMPVTRARRVSQDLRVLLAYERRRRRTDAAFATVDIGEHEGIAIEPAVAVSGDAGQALLRARVSALRPDLLLWLGPGQWIDSLAEVVPWGVWNMDDSLLDADAAALSLAGPVVRGDVATVVGLELFLAEDPPTTLARGWMSTALTSVGLQRELGFRKLPAMLLRAVRRLAVGELPGLARRPAQLRLSGSRPSGAFGTGVAAFGRTLAARIAARRERHPDIGWFVLLRHGARGLEPDNPLLPRAVPILPPAGQFWADPCLVSDEGRHLLFVEQWSAVDERGVIACLELLPEARVRSLGVALDLPFHLSYPQVFRHDDEWFMTAESGQARCVSLYRAARFPMEWECIATLLSGWPCVDPTLHFHDGHWYLFASIAESGLGTCDDLYLFVADHLAGPFSPHPANPIVCDVRSARMAGRLFEHDGRLIRPGQDCARNYGSAIVFNEITELSPEVYRERTLGRLGTEWAPNLRACHTYSTIDGIEVLDARGIPGTVQARATPRTPGAGVWPREKPAALAGPGAAVTPAIPAGSHGSGASEPRLASPQSVMPGGSAVHKQKKDPDESPRPGLIPQ